MPRSPFKTLLSDECSGGFSPSPDLFLVTLSIRDALPPFPPSNEFPRWACFNIFQSLGYAPSASRRTLRKLLGTFEGTNCGLSGGVDPQGASLTSFSFLEKVRLPFPFPQTTKKVLSHPPLHTPWAPDGVFFSYVFSLQSPPCFCPKFVPQAFFLTFFPLNLGTPPFISLFLSVFFFSLAFDDLSPPLPFPPSPNQRRPYFDCRHHGTLLFPPNIADEDSLQGFLFFSPFFLFFSTGEKPLYPHFPLLAESPPFLNLSRLPIKLVYPQFLSLPFLPSPPFCSDSLRLKAGLEWPVSRLVRVFENEVFLRWPSL